MYRGDCLELMKNIKDNSIDMILCDLPYGTTAATWDKIINFEKLWEQYERIIKKDAAIILFGSGQFTYKLISSNEKLYRYKWIWFKNKKSNFINAKNRPMTSYEEIMVFSKGTTANGNNNKMRYYPQGLIKKHTIRTNGVRFGSIVGKRPSHKKVIVSEYTNYPFDVLQFNGVSKTVHPTQKPVDLLKYLIKTYTNENEIVLDNCMGSGSTGVACKMLNRKFIGMELRQDYFNIAVDRVLNCKSQGELFL